MRVEFEGAQYEFPEGATKDQVFSFLKRNREQNTSELDTAIAAGDPSLAGPGQMEEVEVTAQAPTIYESSKAVPRENIFYGADAVKKVEEMEGKELTLAQRRVLEEEGFVDGMYKDTKGIVTYGVGQTNEYMDMSYTEAFAEHEEDARRMLPGYDAYPDYLQAEIMSAAYRGDLAQSPTFRRLMNQGKFEEAAMEFLNHAEYNDPSTPIGIKKRMRKVQDAVRQYAMEQAQQADTVAQTDVQSLLDKVPQAPAFDPEKAQPLQPGSIFEQEDDNGETQFWRINEDGQPEIFKLGDQETNKKVWI